MIPAGYMAKRVQKPKAFTWMVLLTCTQLAAASTKTSRTNLEYWKHNGRWLFDSFEIIRNVAKENSIELDGTSLFYYEVHDMEFDGKSWSPYEAEPSLPTKVVPPQEKVLEGFDVVTFYAKKCT
jgi:hypothetical protein